MKFVFVIVFPHVVLLLRMVYGHTLKPPRDQSNGECGQNVTLVTVPSVVSFVLFMVVIACVVRKIKRPKHDPVPKWTKNKEEREKRFQVQEKVYKELIEVPRRSFRFPFFLPKGRPTGKKPMPLKDEDDQLTPGECPHKYGSTVVKGVQNNGFESEVEPPSGRRVKYKSLERRFMKELQNKLLKYRPSLNSITEPAEKVATGAIEEERERIGQTPQKSNLRNVKSSYNEANTAERDDFEERQRSKEQLQQGSLDHQIACASTKRSQTPSPGEESLRKLQNMPTLEGQKRCDSERSHRHKNNNFKPMCSIIFANPEGTRNSNVHYGRCEDCHIDVHESIDFPEDPCYIQRKDILVHKVCQPSLCCNQLEATRSTFSYPERCNASHANAQVKIVSTEDPCYLQLTDIVEHHGGVDNKEKKKNVPCALISRTQILNPGKECLRNLSNVPSLEGQKQCPHNHSNNNFKPTYSEVSANPEGSRNNSDHYGRDEDSQINIYESIDCIEDPYYIQLKDIVVHSQPSFGCSQLDATCSTFGYPERNNGSQANVQVNIDSTEDPHYLQLTDIVDHPEGASNKKGKKKNAPTYYNVV